MLISWRVTKKHPPHQVLLPPTRGWYPPGSSSKPFEASLDLAQQLGLVNKKHPSKKIWKANLGCEKKYAPV